MPKTKEWTEVNNGKTFDTTPYKFPEEEEQIWDGTVHQRRLKKEIPAYPEDSKFDFAINGEIIKTMDLEEFEAYKQEIAYNVAIMPILDDIKMAEQPVELGIRLRSEKKPRDLVINFNHFYYA